MTEQTKPAEGRVIDAGSREGLLLALKEILAITEDRQQIVLLGPMAFGLVASIARAAVSAATSEERS